jgi:hypothetical protein
MIALSPPKPFDKDSDNLMLVVTIDRPSKEVPQGRISLCATLKPNPDEDPEHFEDAAAGPINEETIEAIIRDLRSYVANGRKSLANDIGRDEETGGKSL